MTKKYTMYILLAAIVLVFIAWATNLARASTSGNHTVLITTNASYYADTDLIAAVQIADTRGDPLSAKFDVELLEAESEAVMVQDSFQTDDLGSAMITLPLYGLESGSYLLRITSPEMARESFEQPISISSVQNPNVTINFNKGLYNPGDEVLFRVLVTNRNTARPVREEFNIRIYDGNNNRVYNETTTTSEFGIISGRFQLAEEVNSGTYRLVVTGESSVTEQTFRVEPYFLPRFEVVVDTDMSEYVLGDTMHITISAGYFFGEPVNQGMVSVTIGGFNESGPLDLSGEFSVSYTPTQTGVHSIDVEVVDNSNHMVIASRDIHVANDVFEIELLPEFGELVRGIPNDIYVFTRRADGSPVRAFLQLTSSNFSRQIATDDNGIAVFTIDPFSAGTFAIDIVAVDMDGSSVRERFELRSVTQNVTIRTDRPIYNAGETITLNILSRVDHGESIIYVYKDDRLLYITSTENDEVEFNLGDTFGIIDIYAIRAGDRGGYSHRTIFIDPGRTMNIYLATDRPEYMPGENVSLNIGVTDAAGNRLESALLVSIVDEAVLAVAANDLSINNIRLALSDIRFSDELDAATLYASIVAGASEQSIMGLLLRQEGISPPYRVSQLSNEQAGRGAASTASSLFVWLVVLIALYLAIRYWGKITKIFGALGSIVVIILIIVLAAVTLTSCGGAAHMPAPAPPPAQDAAPAAPAAPPSVPEAAAPEAAPPPAATPAPPVSGEGAIMFDPEPLPETAQPPAATDGAAPEMDDQTARVRRLFLETLLFIPEVIATDGNATLDFMLADNITTWNIQVVGNSKDGTVGHGQSSIRAFQPFFVDFELPRNSIRGDQISIPVTVFNYTDYDQDVTLTIAQMAWFTLGTSPVHTIHVPSNRSQLTYIPITIQDFGDFTFRADAHAAGFADAAERPIRVSAEGFMVERVVSSGTIDSDTWRHILFMQEDIPDTRRAHIIFYPSAMAQMVSGLENIFRMPTGCFEQISSTLYPNILALRYMEENNIIDAQLAQTARGFLTSGYQRLLTYEVRSEPGGFSMYGHAPAETVLTAYGLMQLMDLSSVYSVDEAVLERMKEFLFRQQNRDGSFEIRGGRVAGLPVRDRLARNAYITWALSESFPNDPRLEASVGYLVSNMNSVDDNYTLALMANVFINVGDRMAEEAVDRLASNVAVTPDGAFISSSVRDSFGTHGNIQDLQTTALTSLALSRLGAHPNTNRMLIDYIISRKDPHGTWHSTQATVLSLKALIEYREAGELEDGQITITIGDTTRTIDIRSDNTLDLYRVTFDNLERESIVEISFPMGGSMVYNIVQEYNVPFDLMDIEESFEITAVMNTELSVNELVTKNIRIINVSGLEVDNAMVVISIPQGFRVEQSSLSDLLHSGVIERFETRFEFINLYLRDIAPGEVIDLGIQYRPGYPANITAGQVRVYDYYNPFIEGVMRPFNVIVS